MFCLVIWPGTTTYIMLMSGSHQDQVTHQIILWLIWLAMLSGIPVFIFVLGPDSEQAENVLGLPPLLMVLPPILAASIVRWIVLPKVVEKGPEAQLVAFIVGMAFAESLVFFGIFLYPADYLLFIVFAVVGIAQFIPLWALPKQKNETGLRSS